MVDNYGEAVYKFCRRLTYTTEDAEDLFQETFLQAFGVLAKINAQDDPKSFLFSTSVYIWKSWKRKYARRSRLAPMQLLEPDDEITGHLNTEDDVVMQEDSRLVRLVVDALPEKFKIPVLLYYTAEMGLSDIADTLRLPVGTVKSRLHKARKMVEKGLVANGYER